MAIEVSRESSDSMSADTVYTKRRSVHLRDALLFAVVVAASHLRHTVVMAGLTFTERVIGTSSGNLYTEADKDNLVSAQGLRNRLEANTKPLAK